MMHFLLTGPSSVCLIVTELQSRVSVDDTACALRGDVHSDVSDGKQQLRELLGSTGLCGRLKRARCVQQTVSEQSGTSWSFYHSWKKGEKKRDIPLLFMESKDPPIIAMATTS